METKVRTLRSTLARRKGGRGRRFAPELRRQIAAVGLFSGKGEVIRDPFSGSGTTGVAAIREGWRFLGWQMNPEYAAIARRRIAISREQLEMPL
jgi:hypothetical protein